jgi:hypothetical protein
VLELVEDGTAGEGGGPVRLRESAGWEREVEDSAEGTEADARLKKDKIDWDWDIALDEARDRDTALGKGWDRAVYGSSGERKRQEIGENSESGSWAFLLWMRMRQEAP